ncbi:MAG: hypothetical protein ACP6IY_16360 [Promethearchaeia archaeon]
MKNLSNFRNLSFKQLIIFTILLSYLGAQRIHEIGHWLVLQLYGREPAFGFTGLIQLWGKVPQHPEHWTKYKDPIDGEEGWLYLDSLPQSSAEWVIMLAAGQIAQIIIIIIGLLIVKYAKKDLSKTFGLLLAMINSQGQIFYFIRKMLSGGVGGDEYFISFYLNISVYLIIIIFLSIHLIGFSLCIHIINDWKLSIKYILVIFLGIMPIGIILMLSDILVREQIDLGNPLFQPVFGFALPVLIIDVIFILLLIFALRHY